MRIFLDANVIFSAALGGESFTQLWNTRTAQLATFCTSPQCVDEARRNLTLKKPHALARLEVVFLDIELVDPPLATLHVASMLRRRCDDAANENP